MRLRPGMFLGGVDEAGVHHMLAEVVDNAVDAAMQSMGKEIQIDLFEDGSCRVSDWGQGMTVEPCRHPSLEGRLLPDIFFTVLHAGGSWGQKRYRICGGLHGVGVAVVNFLSKSLTCEIHRDGARYELRCHDGRIIEPCHRVGPTDRTGTVVRFLPDPAVFKTALSAERVACQLCDYAYVRPELTFRLTVHGNGRASTQHFHQPEGMLGCVRDMSMASVPVLPPFQIRGECDGVLYDAAFQFHLGDELQLASFASGVRCEGGTHLTGFTRAIRAAFGPMRSPVPDESEAPPMSPFIAAVSVWVTNPVYNNARKDRLLNEDAGAVLERETAAALDAWKARHQADIRDLRRRQNHLL